MLLSFDCAASAPSNIPAIQVSPTTSQNTKDSTARAPEANMNGDSTKIQSADDSEELDVNTLPTKDPLTLFQKWFEQAQFSDGIRLATSMTLATASK